MAITAPKKTTDSDLAQFIRPDESAAIFEQAARVSVVQSLVQQVPLGASGQSFPVVTGKMSAGWVSEGGQKPASQGSLGIKSMKPEKIAAIAVVSAEVVRANPGNYINLIRPQIAEAFAVAFDYAALYDRGPTGVAGGGPFLTSISQTTKSVALGLANANGGSAQAAGGVHQDFVNVLSLLVNAGKRLTGYALDEVVEPTLLSSVDTTGNPLFSQEPFTDTVAQAARRGRLLGRPSAMAEGVKEPTPGTVATSYTVGFGGDFSQAAWGVVGGISYDVSTQTAVTINGVLTSLWENNLVAIRAEAEYGFLVNDPESFVALKFKTAP